MKEQTIASILGVLTTVACQLMFNIYIAHGEAAIIWPMMVIWIPIYIFWGQSLFS